MGQHSISKRTARLTIIFCAPFISLLGGCSSDKISCGPGTVENGGQCVVASATDGGAADAIATDSALSSGDGGVPSDARPIASGDALLATSTTSVAPGLVQCRDATVVHTDGSREIVTRADGALTVEIVNGAVAAPADPSDCDGIGILGIAPGQTLARVRFERDGITLQTQIAVTVPNYEVRLLALSGGGYLQAIGDKRERSLLRWGVWDPANNMQTFGSHGGLVGRWLSYMVSDSTILELVGTRYSKNSGDHVVLRGISAGTASVSMIYSIPGQASPVVSPGTQFQIVDVSALPFSNVAGIMLVDAEGFSAPGFSDVPATGVCGKPLLFGWFGTGATRVSAVLHDATWSVSGTGLQLISGGAQTCAATPGEEGAITGCALGDCGTKLIIVKDPAVVSLKSKLIDPATTRMNYVPNVGTLICPKFRIEREYQDGSLVDVTAKPGLTLTLNAYSSSVTTPATVVQTVIIQRATDSNGARVFASDGSLCYTIWQPQDTYEMTFTIQGSAQYADKVADVRFQYLR